MREILFRGKDDCGVWIYGFYVAVGKNSHRMYTGLYETFDYHPTWYNVTPETVGQYTGLEDKNGTKIFEGDILKVKSMWHADESNGFEKQTTYWIVEYKKYNCEMGFFVFGIDRRWHKPLTWSRIYNAEAVVVGNIYDNPELMNGGKEK